MADISFTPTFNHTPWVDNKDRVQAGGTNGFNIRFASLENDLQTISTVVGAIDGALDSLEAGTGPVAQVLSIAPPTFLPIGGATNQVWTQDVDGSAIPSPLHGNADGIMPITLQGGATLTQFAVKGAFSGAGGLELDFQRGRPTGTTATIDLLASVIVGVTPGNTAMISGPNAVVDTNNYYYFVRASIAGAGATTNARIFGIQITFTA